MRRPLFDFERGGTVEQEPKQKGGPGVLGAAAGLAAVLGLMLALLLTGGGGRAAAASAQAVLEVPRQQAAGAAEQEVGNTVIPIGRAVGIKLFSDGVLVVGLSPVETEDGLHSPGKECGLKTGDVITHINGTEVDTIEQVQAVVAERAGETLTIQAMRGQRQLQLTTAAVENSQGVYQLGIWLRDSMAGIGTITFYDPDSGVFAALGHGINDVDTSMLMPLESGSIMPAAVSDVQKGMAGQPGELHGQFDLTCDLGTLYANTNRGIFGRLAEPGLADGLEAVEVADGTRSLMVQITDPELLEATGGIVQGMSGSPILQDGKLVGAVTHVLVNDPTRGYGIFAETMLKAAGGGTVQPSGGA